MPNLETVRRLQELQLEIIACTNFNNLDGIKIKKLLLEHRQLWRAVLITGNEFLLLRELENDHSMADTLYILGKDGFENQLEELVNTNFEASEIEWIRDETALVLLGYHKNNFEQKIPPVLSVWWD
jgi:hypothetical protein